MLDFIDEAMIFAGTAPSNFSVADMIAHQQQMVSEKFYHAIVDSDPALAKIINFDTKNVLLSQISQRHGYVTEQPILTSKGKPNQNTMVLVMYNTLVETPVPTLLQNLLLKL